MRRQFPVKIILAFVLSLAVLHDPSHAGLCRDNTTAPGAGTSPARRRNECGYTMNVGVRLLLFWIGWKNVGGGKITWEEGPNGTQGLELLIGSDPARAPRQINRWGYIAERVSGSSADLVGIMTQSDEQTISQAKSTMDGSGKTHPFKAIRSHSAGGEAQSSTMQLNLDEDFTYRDVSALLDRIPAAGASVRRLRIPDGADSGFLFAIKEMIHDSVGQFLGSGSLNLPEPHRYVYNASLFTLSLVSSRLVKQMGINGREYKKLIESKFEAYNVAKDSTSIFTVAYGTEGPISEIPVRIVYMPRWWFRAELLLDERSVTASVNQPRTDP